MVHEKQARVIHLNNVANVPKTMVRYAREQGRDWRLRELPAASVSAEALSRRALDAWRWFPQRQTADILHVHYAPNGYYFWGSKAKRVLHFHGSDARIDSFQPLKRQLIHSSIKSADAVAFSTPDLENRLHELCETAVYLPNPAPPAPPRSLPVKENRIIFNARWDDSKGGLKLVQAARDLVRAGYEVCGFDWGTYRKEAAAAGVKLLPLASPQAFAEFLTSGKVIVGQFAHPLLSISDLQSLLARRPLVTVLNASGAPTVVATLQNLSEIAAQTAQRDFSVEAAARQVEWVNRNHGPAYCLRQWERLYAQIL